MDLYEVWFSEKESESDKRIATFTVNFALLESGEIVEYTRMFKPSERASGLPTQLYDDYVFLGMGEFSHSKERRTLPPRNFYEKLLSALMARSPDH